MFQEQYQSPTRGKMKWLFLLAFVFVGLEVLIPGVGWTYEALPGFTGQHLTGTVKLKGKIPAAKRFNLALFSDPYYCGRISDGRGWRITPRPALGDHEELGGAVVFLEDVKKGKHGTTAGTIIQTKNCVFLPYMSATQVGQIFHFQNWDPIQHKLEVFLTSQKGAQNLLGQNLEPHPDNRKSDFLSAGQTGFHRAGPEVQYQIDRQGILVFRCTLHDYMEGWSLVLPHPYFSITGKNGEFSLKDIPPGAYTLIVWHPLGRQETSIQIGTGHTQNINILMTPTSPTIYPEEKSANNPFGIDLIGDSSIVPTVERQEWDSGREKALGGAS
ncbi:MAG: carboxypeptidase-like regulatory domain-containing protein [Nitrospirota bacterium]|nr:carboxypeptidase-like regulatory domain-containing protein [Nitrospirota bacterium]